MLCLPCVGHIEAGVIDQFIMESVSFDLWLNALEANMVTRLKKTGSL